MSERLRIVLELNDKGFVSGIQANNRRLKGFGTHITQVDERLKRAERSTASWGRKLKDTAVTLASLNYLIPNLTNVMFGWQRGIINANAELEQSIAIMKNFSTEVTDVGAELEARNFVDMIIKKAAQAPFSINALTDSIVKMKAAGLDNAEQGFNALVDSVAAFGGTDTTLKRASVAISQMSGKGVISMEELRQQLGEAVPSAINIMATSLSTTYSELVKEISKGNVRSDIALVAMFEEMERQLGGSALRMMDTWNGLMAQLSTATTINMQVFGEQGYFDELKNQLRQIIILLNDPSTQRFFADMSKGLTEVVRALSTATKWVLEHKDTILLLGASYLAYTRLTTKFSALTRNAFVGMGKSLDKYAASRKKSFEVVQRFQKREYDAVLKNKALLNSYIAEEYRKRDAMIKSTKVGEKMNVITAAQAKANAHARLAIQAKTVSMEKGAIATKRYSTAMKLMRGAAAGIPGILLSIAEVVGTTLLVSWVSGWGKAENAVRENIKALKEYKGLYADVDMVRDGESEIVKQRKELDELIALRRGKDAAIAENQRILDAALNYGGTGGAEAEAELEVLLNLEDKITEKVNSIGELSRNLRTATRLTVDSVKEQQERVINAAISEQISSMQREYKKTVEWANKKIKDAMGDSSLNESEKADAQDQADAIINEAAMVLVEERIKAAKRQRNELNEVIQNMTLSKEDGGKGFKKTDVEVRGLMESLFELDRRIVEMGSKSGRKNLADALLGDKGTKDVSDVKSYITMVENKLNSLNGELKGFEKSASKSGGEYERFLATLGDAAKHADIKSKLGEIKEKMEQIYSNERFEDTSKDFNKFIAKLGEVETASRAAFSEQSSDSLQVTTKNTVKYQIAMQGLIKDINQYVATKDKQKAAEIIQALAAGKAVAQMQDLSKLYGEITNKNLRLEEQLGKQSEGQESYYDGLIANAQDIVGSLDKEAEGYKKTKDALVEYIANLREMKNLKGLTKDAISEHIKDWNNLELAIDDVKTNALDGFVDVLTNGLTGAASGFKDFAESIIKDITRMIVKFMVMKAITGIMGGFGGNSADAMHSQGMGMDSNGGAITFGNHLDATPFANGGIMSSVGSLPLKKYANGGIANSPQLALFGEGRMNEAYVPLPDGRTIPVTMKGGSGGDVQVNIFNQGGQKMEGESNTRFDGEKMIVDVMLKHMNQPGRVRESMRSV